MRRQMVRELKTLEYLFWTSFANEVWEQNGQHMSRRICQTRERSHVSSSSNFQNNPLRWWRDTVVILLITGIITVTVQNCTLYNVDYFMVLKNSHVDFWCCESINIPNFLWSDLDVWQNFGIGNPLSVSRVPADFADEDRRQWCWLWLVMVGYASVWWLWWLCWLCSALM